VLLLLDMISFILLLIFWGYWTSGNSSDSVLGAASFTIRIEVSFIFVLLIHMVLLVATLWVSRAARHAFMLAISGVWFAYTYCMTFFYIPSQTRSPGFTLRFYFLFRCLSALVVAHKCIVGRLVITFRYPNFARDWRIIAFADSFVRYCPFVFEVNTIVDWIARRTRVSLGDFVIVRDVALQLEILVAHQMNPKYGEARRPLVAIAWGVLGLIAVVLFVPLFFVSERQGVSLNNPPITATFEIGIGSIPTLYIARGVISPVSKEEQALLPSGVPELLLTADPSHLSRIDFATFSYSNWVPEGAAKDNILELITDAPSFYRFTLNFNFPAGPTESTTVVWEQAGEPMTGSYADLLARYIELGGGGVSADDDTAPISLPLTIELRAGAPVEETLIRRSGALQPSTYADGLEWNLFLDRPSHDWPLWSAPDKYSLIIWSQALGTGVKSLGNSGAVVAIYVVIMIVLGLLVRRAVVGGVDQLWIDRMERPQKLYRMVVAIDAFRSAQDQEKEAEVVEQFLNTLKSKETCLKITASDAVD
jgi:hypothetical protein